MTDAITTKIGTGLMGACCGVRLAFGSDFDAPDRLIAKLPSEDAGSREFAARLGAYAREVNFYRDVAPTVRVRAPACYFAHSADNGERFVLLLEDLPPATKCSQIEGCTPAQARLAQEQAAALHGSSWHDTHLQTVPWLHTGTQVWDSFGANTPAIQQGLRARYGGTHEEGYLAVGNRLAAGGTIRWLNRMRRPRCCGTPQSSISQNEERLHVRTL